MRCISLTQAYATLIALGAKTIETRSWSADYRGPLAIHAAKGLGSIGGVRGLRRLIHTEPFYSVFTAYDAGWGTDVCNDPSYYLPFGKIIAVCELKDCLSTTGRRNEYGTGPKYADWVHDLTAQERAFGDYSPNRYAYRLASIRPLPTPIPAKGVLGLWTPPPAVLAQIEAALNGEWRIKHEHKTTATRPNR